MSLRFCLCTKIFSLLMLNYILNIFHINVQRCFAFYPTEIFWKSFKPNVTFLIQYFCFILPFILYLQSLCIHLFRELLSSYCNMHIIVLYRLCETISNFIWSEIISVIFLFHENFIAVIYFMPDKFEVCPGFFWYFVMRLD